MNPVGGCGASPAGSLPCSEPRLYRAPRTKNTVLRQSSESVRRLAGGFLLPRLGLQDLGPRAHVPQVGAQPATRSPLRKLPATYDLERKTAGDGEGPENRRRGVLSTSRSVTGSSVLDIVTVFVSSDSCRAAGVSTRTLDMRIPRGGGCLLRGREVDGAADLRWTCSPGSGPDFCAANGERESRCGSVNLTEV